MKLTITALAALILALVLTPAEANADTDELHPDAQYALETVPGGIAVSESEVVWPTLGMTLEAQSATQRAVGSCATGTYCAYAQSGLRGTKLTFTICTNVSTAALQTVGSIANGRSSGNVHARNGGTILATAGANGSANVGGGTTNLLCTL